MWRVSTLNSESKPVLEDDEKQKFNEFSQVSEQSSRYCFSDTDPIGKTQFFHSFLVANKMFILPKKYHIEKVMGKGSYGIVCKAQNTQTKEEVAIK